MLWMIVIGFFIGAVAKFLMPGANTGGFVTTMLLGIGGAMLADFAGTSFGFYHRGEFYGFLSAVLGAMAILFLYATLTRDRRIVRK